MQSKREFDGASVMPERDPDIDELLSDAARGDRAAAAKLFTLAYPRLKAIAQAKLSRTRDHTLQATAVVNEAYFKIMGSFKADVRSQEHFIAIASQAIRQVLVEYARAKGTVKRGGGVRPVPLEGLDVGMSGRPVDILALDDAMNRLAQFDARAAQVVQLRYFGGLKFEAIARELSVSLRTAKNDWEFAKGWLLNELRG